jgi:hypothetical protein
MEDHFRCLVVGIHHLVIHATLRAPVNVVAGVWVGRGSPGHANVVSSAARQAGEEEIGKQKGELQERRLHYS